MRILNWDISHGMTQKARNISVFFRVFPWLNRTEATQDHGFVGTIRFATHRVSTNYYDK